MKRLKQWWKNLSRKKKFIWIAALGLFLVGWFLLIMWWSVWSWEVVDEYSYYDENYGYVSCDFSAVTIQGDITTYLTAQQYEEDYASAEEILYILDGLDSQGLPAIMLDITSWGGSPAPSKEIADFVAQMKTPVIASIREAALSGAYYIASQADEVFASPASDIGSIGVTMSYLDEARLNTLQGYTWNSLSTGRFKDAGSSEKPLTRAERELFQRDLDILHDMFVQDVARGRGLPVEEVQLLADGSSVLSDQALKLGLIDGVKHQWEVIDYIAEKYNTGDVACWE